MVIGYRVVHAGFCFQPGAAPQEKLEKLFAKVSADWTRYDGHCWLLYSNRSLESLCDSIRESGLTSSQDEFLLCEMQTGSYSGFLGEKVLAWLQQYT